MIKSEPLIETLVQASYRCEIETEANKKVEAVNFRQVFKPIKADEELANIVRHILPQHLKNTLLTSIVCIKKGGD